MDVAYRGKLVTSRDELSRIDVSRLTNAANDQIDSLDARADLSRKIRQRRQVA